MLDLGDPVDILAMGSVGLVLAQDHRISEVGCRRTGRELDQGLECHLRCHEEGVDGGDMGLLVAGIGLLGCHRG